MAHFAELDENNYVVGINVVDNHKILDESGNEQEALGIAYLASLWGDSIWKQCSYNKNIRKNYPGVGFWYDEVNDAFIAPKPFPSWILNNYYQWEAPIPEPIVNETQRAQWNEEIVNWDVIDFIQ